MQDNVPISLSSLPGNKVNISIESHAHFAVTDFQKSFLYFGLKYPCYVGLASEWDSTVFLLGKAFKIDHLFFFQATTVCQVKKSFET